MEGFNAFCSTWYWLFIILAFPLGAGICGFFIDNNSNVIEIDEKKKELLEKNRDMSIIKSTLKNKTLALSGLEDKPVDVVGDTGAATTATSGAQEDLNAPLDLKL